MTRATLAELRTMAYTRSLSAVAAAALAAAAVSALFASVKTLSDALHSEIVVLTLFLLVIGVIASAGEYQHGTVQWTLLGTPNRLAAAAGKLVAAALLGIVVAAGVLAVTWIVCALRESGLRVGVAVGGLIGGQLALGALTACFGVACGIALRSLPGGVAAVFTFALVLPLALQAKQSLDSLARFLPYGELSAASLALGASPADFGPQLASAPAGLVLAAWTALIWVLALGRLLRQDV